MTSYELLSIIFCVDVSKCIILCFFVVVVVCVYKSTVIRSTLFRTLENLIVFDFTVVFRQFLLCRKRTSTTAPANHTTRKWPELLSLFRAAYSRLQFFLCVIACADMHATCWFLWVRSENDLTQNWVKTLCSVMLNSNHFKMEKTEYIACWRMVE